MTFQAFNPEGDVRIFRSHLPHWRQSGTTYFVTTRLADSVPQPKLRAWQEERDIWLRAHDCASIEEVEGLPKTIRDEFHRQFTARFHGWLDAGYGACLFRDAAAAQIVAEALRFFDFDRYLLDAFVVMPNHLHLLVTPAPDYELSELLRSWKGFTARAINKLLHRSGTVWQQESFDHIVRSSSQFERFRSYIAQNPLKARLQPGEYFLGPPKPKQDVGESGDAGK